MASAVLKEGRKDGHPAASCSIMACFLMRDLGRIGAA